MKRSAETHTTAHEVFNRIVFDYLSLVHSQCNDGIPVDKTQCLYVGGEGSFVVRWPWF